ncbi:myelin-oligodendrocyte glycoprotein-like [Girardinichthys multiradiatus]|uniref:myelin-oligodendrocyte glycoprotein-like n=1 Tax=Girardinichthys multiradiatus TaxID=208333 RepID=UPI001FAB85F7|nr:myelin-oligodendrocyte glycoprotein-like [Girardinichthys multiradiatus]
MTLRFRFLLFALFSAQTPVKGHYKVTGSHQPILAAPGEDVVLLCQVEPEFDVVDLTVEWSKPDLKPDPNYQPKGMGYVHLYRDNLEVPDMKIFSYKGRTALFDDGLRQGNISLRITNVTAADEGQYRCFIPKLNGQIKSSTVHLIIDQNSSKTTTTKKPLHLQTRQNDLNGGLSCCSSLTPLMVVWILLIYST